ncbi:hypothetical protein BOSE127_10001 [Bosea sp. 127]|nr:hypothetical protein BOSE127_10001 [Bosea sp. 127]
MRWGRVRDGGPESRNAILNRFAKRHCPPPQPSPPQAGGGEGRFASVRERVHRDPAMLQATLVPAPALRQVCQPAQERSSWTTAHSAVPASRSRRCAWAR